MSDLSMPDKPPLPIDGLCVCRTCCRVYGQIRDRDGDAVQPAWQQRCDCEPSSRFPIRPDLDFPEAVTLCRCCGRQVLPSGSRRSIWFCRGCRHAVEKINRAARCHLIPIGRFTLLEQIGLEDDAAHREVPVFTAIRGDWFERIEHLERLAWLVVKNNLKQFGGRSSAEVSLSDYCDRFLPTADVLRASIWDLGRSFDVPAYVLADAAAEII
jgi:hypothetical protein